MKKMLSFILLVVILGACGQQHDEISPEDERGEGIIVHIENWDSFEGKYSILAIPEVENINFINKTKEELIKLAQENNGAFYVISQEKYDELRFDIGDRLIAYYNGEGESDPPVRITEKVEVVSE